MEYRLHQRWLTEMEYNGETTIFLNDADIPLGLATDKRIEVNSRGERVLVEYAVLTYLEKISD